MTSALRERGVTSGKRQKNMCSYVSQVHDRQVCGGDFLRNVLLQRQQKLHAGEVLHETGAASAALMPLLLPGSKTISNCLPWC